MQDMSILEQQFTNEINRISSTDTLRLMADLALRNGADIGFVTESIENSIIELKAVSDELRSKHTKGINP